MVPSSFLLLVAMPGAPSSVLAPSSILLLKKLFDSAWLVQFHVRGFQESIVLSLDLNRMCVLASCETSQGLKRSKQE